jgi:hypothetical protein
MKKILWRSKSEAEKSDRRLIIVVQKRMVA